MVGCVSFVRKWKVVVEAYMTVIVSEISINVNQKVCNRTRSSHLFMLGMGRKQSSSHTVILVIHSINSSRFSEALASGITPLPVLTPNDLTQMPIAQLHRPIPQSPVSTSLEHRQPATL